MIRNRIKVIRNKFKNLKIDGYIIPKNDEFFSEYADKDRLKTISNFTGSAGLAIILRRKNYLFVDGRYTIQAQKQSGKLFKVIEIHKFLPGRVLKNLTLGFDPSIFTTRQIKIYFGKSLKLKPLNTNLVDLIYKKKPSKIKPFFSLKTEFAGTSHIDKKKKF